MYNISFQLLASPPPKSGGAMRSSKNVASSRFQIPRKFEALLLLRNVFFNVTFLHLSYSCSYRGRINQSLTSHEGIFHGDCHSFNGHIWLQATRSQVWWAKRHCFLKCRMKKSYNFLLETKFFIRFTLGRTTSWTMNRFEVEESDFKGLVDIAFGCNWNAFACAMNWVSWMENFIFIFLM